MAFAPQVREERGPVQALAARFGPGEAPGDPVDVLLRSCVSVEGEEPGTGTVVPSRMASVHSCDRCAGGPGPGVHEGVATGVARLGAIVKHLLTGRRFYVWNVLPTGRWFYGLGDLLTGSDLRRHGTYTF